MNIENLSNYEFWTEELLEQFIYDYANYSAEDILEIIKKLNKEYPPKDVLKELLDRRSAIQENQKIKNLLKNLKDPYPKTIKLSEIKNKSVDLSSIAIVLTAGGDGERLMQSLKNEGKTEEEIKNFTKATIPLPGFADDKSTLEINLRLIQKLEESLSITIPVIVTLGPIGSKTAELIPKFLKENENFDLKKLITVPQFKRIHFSNEEKIVLDKNLNIITNPDETGGPIVRLKYPILKNEETGIEWLKNNGVNHVLILQAIGLYDFEIIKKIVSQKNKADLIALGIIRKEFRENDYFGTFIYLNDNEKRRLKILESHVIDENIRSIKNNEEEFLPYNPGLYLFEISLIDNINEIPFYASSDKEIKDGVEKAPKIGFAATDLTLIAKNPKILLIDNLNFSSLIKDYESLKEVSEFRKKHNLEII